MIVKDIMRKPFVVDEDLPLADAAKLMASKKISSLLFIQKDKLAGILTERDIMKNFGSNEKISQAMTRNPESIGPGEDLEEALEIMKSKKIKRLPVVDKEELVGIISITDIIAHWEEIDSEEEFFF